MDSWVIIQTFINPQEAYMAKAFLESAGIGTRMQDELMAQTGIHAQAIGGVKLLVQNECWQEALKVLEEGGYRVREEAEQMEDWAWADKQGASRSCPFCHSDEIEKCKNQNSLSRAVFSVLAIFSPLFRPTWKCSSCGKAWKYK